jgi:hypothetical protein
MEEPIRCSSLMLEREEHPINIEVRVERGEDEDKEKAER